MRSFKNIKIFEKKLKQGLCWEDCFKLGGKVYNIYEYGEHENDYVYFLNKRTNTLIYINYICPTYQYVKRVKTQIKEYKFIRLEVEENATLWR